MSVQIVPFLSFLNQLKIYHWQTFSYAQHKALGNAYEDLDELFDTFIETYLGKYGKNYENKQYSFTLDSLKEDTDVKKFFQQKKMALLNYLRNDLLSENDKDLLNIADEIEGKINHLQYLLDLK